MPRFITQLLLPLLFGTIGAALFTHFHDGHQTQAHIPPRQDRSDLPAPELGIPPTLQSVYDNPFTHAAALASPSVVHVKSVAMVQENSPWKGSILEFFFGQGAMREVGNSGSGVIVRPEGYVVTNHHVVQGAQRIAVTLSNRKVYDAKLVAVDPAVDLALLKVETSDTLQAIPFGQSDSLRVGSWILAIGNPFDLETTVTAGIVSAKARSLNLQRGRAGIESFIQIDAAVNPGNSGGALVDLNGKLVGINTAIASPTGAFAGYAFSIPSTVVQKFVNDILEYGRVNRGYLGVGLREMQQQLADQLSDGNVIGVLVTEIIPRGAAARAGIHPGDIIVQVNEWEVNSIAELQERVGTHSPGDTIGVTILRHGHRATLRVTLM